MRHNHSIPIARGDAAHQPLAGAFLEILFGRDQNVSAGIESQQFRGKLAEHVVWNAEQGLARQPQSFQFHCGRNHRVGLARADDVGQQTIWRLQSPPYGCALV